jgi:glutamyl-tRNA reductase
MERHPDADRGEIEALLRRTVNQLLHQPTTLLREAAEEGREEDLLAAMRLLTGRENVG